MLGRAIIERWRIDEHLRNVVIESVKYIMELPNDGNEKLKLKAIQNLAMLDKLNVEMMKAFIPQQHIHMNVQDLTDEQLERAILEQADKIKAEKALTADELPESSINSRHVTRYGIIENPRELRK